MKKVIAVLLTGTFIIGTAVAQSVAPMTKPVAKKETVASVNKATEKKAEATDKKVVEKKHHHKGAKAKKAKTTKAK